MGQIVNNRLASHLAGDDPSLGTLDPGDRGVIMGTEIEKHPNSCFLEMHTRHPPQEGLSHSEIHVYFQGLVHWRPFPNAK